MLPFKFMSLNTWSQADGVILGGAVDLGLNGLGNKRLVTKCEF